MVATNFSSLASYLLGGGFLLYVLRVLLRAFNEPLRDAPGPWLARFTRFWYLRELHRGHFEKTNIELHRKYGPIVRIAPGQYSIDDPNATKIIYGTSPNWHKSSWYSAVQVPLPGLYNTFAERDPKMHSWIRRRANPLYTMTSVVRMESFVTNCVDILQQKFASFAQQNTAVDMNQWLKCYAFDCIGEITLGERFGSLDSGVDVGGLIEANRMFSWYFSRIGIYPEWHPYTFQVLARLGPKDRGFPHLQSEVDRIMAEAQATELDSNAGDSLTRGLILNRDNPDGFSLYDVKLMTQQNVGAGADTTSFTLAAVLYYLYRSPRCLERLRREIDERWKSGELSDPITYQEAQQAPYLQAVMKEAMRMFPVIGLPMMRIVPEGGATIAGRFFPKGTTVGINAWVAHYNPSVFPEPEVFRPERWLDAGSKDLQEQYYIPFGLGSRTCIGKNISILEMSKLVPQIVRKFDVEILNEWKTENWWFVGQSDFNVRLKAREGK